MIEPVQVRFASTVQSIAAFIQPYIGWIEQSWAQATPIR
jgi:hypothetical protein